MKKLIGSVAMAMVIGWAAHGSAAPASTSGCASAPACETRHAASAAPGKAGPETYVLASATGPVGAPGPAAPTAQAAPAMSQEMHSFGDILSWFMMISGVGVIGAGLRLQRVPVRSSVGAQA